MKTLLVTFRQDNNTWQSLYKSLYDSPLSCHLDVNIRQMNASREFPAFFYYTNDLVLVLSKIRAESLKLHEMVTRIPGVAIRQFMRSSLIEEIQASNAIEGVRSTKKEIAHAVDAQEDASMSNVRLWSVVNKYEKLQGTENIPFETSCDLRNFYDSFVLDEVIRSDPRNAPDGEIFRCEGVEIQGRTKILHRGLYPEDVIVKTMDKALGILQDQGIPDLVRVSIFHYLFGYIHPFYDGNGRTSRFVVSYYLSRLLHPLIALRLSLTIKRNQRVYYQLFDSTNAFGNCGDLTPFITGFLLLIEKSISRVINLLKEKDRILVKLGARLSDMSVGTQLDSEIYFVLLQAALFSEDGASLEEIAGALRRSSRTILTHIKKYHKKHVIIDKSHRAYRYKLNVAILDSD